MLPSSPLREIDLGVKLGIKIHAGDGRVLRLAHAPRPVEDLNLDEELVRVPILVQAMQAAHAHLDSLSHRRYFVQVCKIARPNHLKPASE